MPPILKLLKKEVPVVLIPAILPPPPPEASAPSHLPEVELYFKNLSFTFAVEISTSSKSWMRTAPPPPKVDSCFCILFMNNLYCSWNSSRVTYFLSSGVRGSELSTLGGSLSKPSCRFCNCFSFMLSNFSSRLLIFW